MTLGGASDTATKGFYLDDTKILVFTYSKVYEVQLSSPYTEVDKGGFGNKQKVSNIDYVLEMVQQSSTVYSVIFEQNRREVRWKDLTASSLQSALLYD